MTDSVMVRECLDLEVTGEVIENIIEQAGFGIGYWALAALVTADQKYIVTEYGPEHGGEGREFTLKHRDLAAALTGIVSGKYTHITSYLVNAARAALFEKDAGEIDSDLADVIVQCACFQDVIFS